MMTEHYVSLLDSGFLPWLLCLAKSLERHAGSYHLWVIAMDEALSGHVAALGIDHVTCIPLAEVETAFPELVRVKPTRNRAEYCWTVTPFTFSAVWKRDSSIERVTYVDADVALLADPQGLFAGFNTSGASVQITDHGHDPAWAEDRIKACGRYCVQFLTVKQSEAGQRVVHWWQARCIEWCYNRNEPGRYGDQKYLDDWPVRFAGDVHVLADPTLTQAPWNRDISAATKPILYHYQGFRPIGGGRMMLWYGFRIRPGHVSAVYDGYLHDFAESLRRIAEAGIAISEAKYHPLKRLKARWWLVPRHRSRIVALPLLGCEQ